MTTVYLFNIIYISYSLEVFDYSDKFRRAKSDSEAAASLLDLSKGDTDVLTEDGAGIHQNTVAASSAFSSKLVFSEIFLQHII